MNKLLEILFVIFLCVSFFLGYCFGKVVVKRLGWDKTNVSIEPQYPPDHFPGSKVEFRATPTLRN